VPGAKLNGIPPLDIDPHGGLPIYRQVMNQIRRQIMTGQLATGDQLESVKSLSSRLKVNPMTISKAYGFLVEEGLAERRRGIGLFVSHVRADSRRRLQQTMLREAFEKAAALAVQMGIPVDEATRLFSEQLRKLNSTGKGHKR
jgi:GntR family transcriptional regulator